MTKCIHTYFPNSVPETKQQMMQAIGIKNIEELYADVPAALRLKKRLSLPEEGLPEFEVRRHVEGLLSDNKTSGIAPAFLGAGCWPHYVPAVVKTIVERSEFLTSYTPYQPEISQGMLQAMFEYQSLICELVGMDVANSSMYDWASALGEAARMASRVTRHREILVPEIIHPDRLATLKVYTEPAGIEIRQVNYDPETGQLNLGDLHKKISVNTAAVYIENPSYLGFIETQGDEISSEAHKVDALFIAGVDPTSLGILEPPGEYGADIVIGEGQPLGNAMNFGGPLLGIMACREDNSLIRQMPGRIMGITTTQDGTREGYCMALQTREQHIRREKATSNICTNEALCALASCVYLALLGPQGLRDLGKTIISRSNYAIKMLSNIEGIRTPVLMSPHFKEFTVNFDSAKKSVKTLNRSLLEREIHGGKDISKEFPVLGQTALYCVTETHSKSDIDNLVQNLAEILGERK